MFTIRVYDPFGTSAFQESLFRQRHARWQLNARKKVSNQNRSVGVIVEGHRGGNACKI